MSFFNIYLFIYIYINLNLQLLFIFGGMEGSNGGGDDNWPKRWVFALFGPLVFFFFHSCYFHIKYYIYIYLFTFLKTNDI